MVFVAGRKGAAFRQQQDDPAQLGQILAAPLSQLNVTPKLRTTNQVPGGQIPRSLNSAWADL